MIAQQVKVLWCTSATHAKTRHTERECKVQFHLNVLNFVKIRWKVGVAHFQPEDGRYDGRNGFIYFFHPGIFKKQTYHVCVLIHFPVPCCIMAGFGK